MPRTVFFGTPLYAVPSLEMLVAEGHDVVAVYTQPDRAAGRGRRERAPPVKKAAEALGIGVYQPSNLRRSEAVAEFTSLAPELVVVAAYGLLLPNRLLGMVSRGCVALHPSLLPRHRGPSPVVAALLAGDMETGSTVFLVDAGMDTGPILAQRPLLIRPEETAESLTEGLARQGAELLCETLAAWLRGGVTAVAQNEAEATYSRRAEKSDGLLDWSRPAVELAVWVRAYSPWPSAFAWWEGRQFKVLGAVAREGGGGAAPGRVVETGWPGEVGVATVDGVLALRWVQLEGRRATAIEEFLRGHRQLVGATLVGREGV